MCSLYSEWRPCEAPVTLKSVPRLTAIRTRCHSLQTEMHFSPKTAFEFPDLFCPEPAEYQADSATTNLSLNPL